MNPLQSFYLYLVIVLAIILVLAVVVLLFPIHIWVEFFRSGEEDLKITVRFLRWTLWDNQTENVVAEEMSKEPAAIADTPVSRTEAPLSSPTPAETKPFEDSKPVKPAESSPAREHKPIAQESVRAPEQEAIPTAEPTAEPTASKPASEPKSNNDRAMVALALHPQLEGAALRLLKKILVNLFRIFKIRIPNLQVAYGHENPANMGWITGAFWAVQSAVPAMEGWELIPVWDRPGFAGIHARVRIQITVLRIVRFLASSLWGLLRLAWLGWRLWKIFKRDPVHANLSTWRRWVLNKISPLIPEVQNDQT